MTISIHLKCDEEFFHKLKKDKIEREFHMGKQMTWEVYVALLFGNAKRT